MIGFSFFLFLLISIIEYKGVMRKLICGNWKANCNKDTFEYLKMYDEYDIQNKTDILLALPSIYLNFAKDILPSNILPCAQDISQFEDGSYTGEITAKMLNDCKVEYSIIGHSERLKYCDETYDKVNRKIKIALKFQIKPIICLGEPIDARKTLKHLEYIEDQLNAYLKGISNVKIDFAYEPIWAIGTGLTANCSQISEVLEFMRKIMLKKNISGRILYGGSIDLQNIKEISQIKELDGALIGKASLSCKFFDIINAFNQTSN